MDEASYPSIRCEGSRKGPRTFLLLLILGVLLVFSASSAWACSNSEVTASATHTSSTPRSTIQANSDRSGAFSIQATSIRAEALEAASVMTPSSIVLGSCCAGSGSGSFCAGFHCTACGIADLPFERTSDLAEPHVAFAITQTFLIDSTARSPDLRPPISC